MKSYTAFTTIKGKKRAHKLSEVMETIVPLPVGIGVFEIEDGSNTWEIAGYYIDKPDEIALSLLSVLIGRALLFFQMFLNRIGLHMYNEISTLLSRDVFLYMENMI